jgi:quinol monooxygenase YgiN
VPITRTEAGNLDYRLYRSTSDDHVFFLFSRYASEKLFDVHLYEPYSMSLLAEIEDLCESTPRVETYETVLG